MCFNKTSMGAGWWCWHAPTMCTGALGKKPKRNKPRGWWCSRTSLRLRLALWKWKDSPARLPVCLHGVGITLASNAQELTPGIWTPWRAVPIKWSSKRNETLFSAWGLPSGNLPPLWIIDSRDDCPSQRSPCVLLGTRPLPFRPQQDIRR